MHLSLYELVDLLNEVSQAEYTLHNLKEDIIQKLDEIADVKLKWEITSLKSTIMEYEDANARLEEEIIELEKKD